jgi:hypothetical protein
MQTKYKYLMDIGTMYFLNMCKDAPSTYYWYVGPVTKQVEFEYLSVSGQSIETTTNTTASKRMPIHAMFVPKPNICPLELLSCVK